jgi:hypothetical protein
VTFGWVVIYSYGMSRLTPIIRHLKLKKINNRADNTVFWGAFLGKLGESQTQAKSLFETIIKPCTVHIFR